MTPKDIALEIINVLDLHKAENIRAVDVRGVSNFTEFCVVASGNSAPHLKALIAYTQSRMKELDVLSYRKSGQPESGWLIIDFVDVVVHLFIPEARAYYDIESLWKDGKELPRAEKGKR